MTTNNISMDKNFDRAQIEKKWRNIWLEKDIFRAGKAKDLQKVPYTIMMPPPNVTGVLHNGHALFVTLEDILVRFWRMKGRDVLWLPGTDHAGISTQTVVERELKKREGKTRHDLGRDKFLERVFAWKDKHGSTIIEQLKLMGASADWSRLRFTMDEQCSLAVKTAFVKLWDEGLIYRKERLINWDPATKTALSNEEVEHQEREGELFYFAYKLKENPNQEIIVATTRPETMLGDTAVAVNPKDSRYKNLIGKELIHPFIADRSIKVIGDDYVDLEFGSGAVKITPAHDPNDFLIGTRHKLPFINIFTLEGAINDQGAEFQGLDRFKARALIKEKLRELGLFRKSQAISHSVTISQRSGVDIEPMLSRQYFVNAKPLAKKAYDAVESGEVRIIPASFKKIYDHFMLNIEDWCISRQLWWGHRIPVFYHIEKMKKAVLEQGPNTLAYNALNNDEEPRAILNLALKELSEESIRSFSEALIDSPKDQSQYLQEEDVLDTWFSAGLWPFSTLGWPKETPDLARYYPGAVLETGSDILFFWVARMMMFGIHFMGKPPFKDIYLHPMVRDSHGRKMSKSLGNAIDPLDVIEGISLNDLLEKTKTYPVPESHLPMVLDGLKKDFPEGIPSVGADGLRFSLAIFSGQGQNVKFSIPRVLGYRAFLNKVWNATRFALMNIDGQELMPFSEAKKHLSIADRAILSALNETIQTVDKNISEYNFSEAAQAIYHFFWNEYCDHYIECAKVSFRHGSSLEKRVTESIIIHLLDNSMRLLHPFCPFISEEIWQSLPGTKDSGVEFCALAPFPSPDQSLFDTSAQSTMALVFNICTMINNARQSSNIAANIEVPVQLLAKDQEISKMLSENKELIAHMAKAKSIEIFLRGQHQVPRLSAINSSAEADAAILLEGLIDLEKERARLQNALTKVKASIVGLEKRLATESFVRNAPEEVVLACQNELCALKEKEEQISQALGRLA